MPMKPIGVLYAAREVRRVLISFGDCDVGQPIMAAAAFQAASLFGEKSVFFKNKLHFGGRLPSRFSGGWSR